MVKIFFFREDGVDMESCTTAFGSDPCNTTIYSTCSDTIDVVDLDSQYILPESPTILSCVDFNDQRVVFDLQSLQSESSEQHRLECDDVKFRIKNPKFYPISSRALALDDFQYLVQ